MKIFVLFLILFSGIYLTLSIYIIKNAEKDEKKPADVILVLGAPAYHGLSYNHCLVARVKHGVELYKANYAPKLLFTGGTDKSNGVNEAQTMKKIALSLGVPAKDILLEQASTSTYENFLFSKKILKANKLKSIIVVTEAYHEPRAMLIASKFGLDALSSPATNSICWIRHKYWSHYFLKEPLAIMLYKMRSRI